MVKRRLKGRTQGKAPRTAERRSPLRKLETDTDVQTSYFFMLNCLLHSRVHLGLESNSEIFDEDVNVYLAHLLNAHIDAKYLTRVTRYIAQSDADIARIASDGGDARRCYSVYKANADFLLMAVSVFDLFDEPRHSIQFPLRTPKHVYVGRTAAYYSLAASYASKLANGQCAISETLMKISDRIESYVRILSYMRGQYLDFVRRYSEGELFHLDRVLQEVEKDFTIEQMRNEFLDTYHAWMQTGIEELKEKLTKQAELLKELDPSFEFTPPS
jgi:hypothetical protein